MCDSPFCITQVETELMSTPEFDRSSSVVFDFTADQKVSYLIGMIVESALILVCVGAFLLVAVIWRVARDSIVNLIIIGMLICSQVLLLAYWVNRWRMFYPGVEIILGLEWLLFIPSVFVVLVYLKYVIFVVISKNS